VLYVDIDGFKRVNDVLGHAAGDILLRDIAGRLSKVVRGTDTLARMGGDEFLVVCEDLERLEDAREITARVRSCFAEEFTLGDESRRVTASVGTAFAGDRPIGVDELVGEADAAMYRAKAEHQPGGRLGA
jgi:diguanylate cyclase (GGDEF)-like protein